MRYKKQKFSNTLNSYCKSYFFYLLCSDGLAPPRPSRWLSNKTYTIRNVSNRIFHNVSYISYQLSSRRAGGMPFSSNSICVRLAYALLGLFIAGCIGAAVAIAIFFAAHKTSSPANGNSVVMLPNKS